MLDSRERQLDKRLLELTALFEISRSLTSSLNLHAIIENILRISMGHMLISKGLVLLKKEHADFFTVEDVKGIPRNLLGQSLQMDSLPAHPIVIAETSTSEEWHLFFKKLDIQLIIPLISSQGIIGIVGFGSKIDNEGYGEEELEFLDSLSNIAATSVANGIMFEEIQTVNRRLDRKIQQLNTIFDISGELNATLDQKKIGRLLGFAVMGELLVNRYAVFVKNNGSMQLLLQKGVQAGLKGVPELNEITDPLLLEDIERFIDYKEAGFSVLVPMRVQDETKGILVVGARISGANFDEADLEFLKTLGNQAMTSLENARLFEETLEKQRMEEELNLARQIQQNLLPSVIPKWNNYDVHAINIPSREVGGDYFDFLEITESEWGIAIGDVSGKGAGAALLMASLQASLRALVTEPAALDKIIVRVNELIQESTDLDKYITFFYGVLDINKHTFTYCNAGHNYPYIFRADGEIETLKTGGIVIGMMKGVTYQVGTVALNPGDWIIMYTDGVTEAMNRQDEEFGEKQLKELLSENIKKDVKSLIQIVLDRIQDFAGDLPQADDQTVVGIHRLT